MTRANESDHNELFRQGRYEPTMLRFWEETLRYFYLTLPGRLPGNRLLDVGCGRGALITWAEHDGLTALGVEPFWPSPLLSTRIARGYGEQLPFADDTFDLLVSFSVLAHVRDPVACLKEMRRVLRPGCSAFVAIPELEGYRFLRRDIYARLTSERWLRELLRNDSGLSFTRARHIGVKYTIPLLRRTATRLAPSAGLALLGWIYRRSYPLFVADLSICEIRRD